VVLVILNEKKERLRKQVLVDLKDPENSTIKIIKELPAGYPGILPGDYQLGED
jgi:hypothetical protein